MHQYIIINVMHAMTVVIHPDISQCMLDLVLGVESIIVGVQLTTGDHISVSRCNGMYQHHGVCLGNNNIIHCTGDAATALFTSSGVMQEDALHSVVKIDSIEKFVGAQGGKVTIVQQGDVRPDALFLMGHHNYNLISNNCEHFANHILNIQQESRQVNRVTTGVVVLLLVMLSIMFFRRGGYISWMRAFNPYY